MQDRRQKNKPLSRIYKVVRAVVGVFLLLSFGMLIASLVAVTNNPETSGPIYLTLINANLVLVIIFMLYIGRRLVLIFLDRRGRLMGARLHVRLLGIFSILAVLPAILVSVFAIYMTNHAIDSWFSKRVNTALEGSLLVAQSYLKEHENRLLTDALAIARDPTLKDQSFLLDTVMIQDVLRHEQEARHLDELSLYDGTTGTMLASSGVMVPAGLSAEIQSLFRLEGSAAEVFQDLEERRVVAAAPVGKEIWLVATRWINPSVIGRIDQTHEAFREYYNLRKDRDKIRMIFTFFLILLAVAALAGAIWAGLRLATRLVKPITALVHGTNRVSAGDLEVRLTPKDDDELGILTQSFNRMARQLKSGRDLLERKNKEIDERRRTMESLLTGVSAGVVSLSAKGVVLTLNKTAREELGIKTGAQIKKTVPELGELFSTFMKDPKDLLQQQLKLERNGESKTLLVRLVPQRAPGGKVQAVVVTFDDITPLMSAQKVAAWSDVARRLAHEIKNPLTPIQLSAERLRRKYLSLLKPEANKELFEQLTQTIVRQAEEMRVMVNEFSDFARMPAPVMGHENMLDMLDEILLLQKTGRSDIKFINEFNVTQKEAMIECDRTHVERALTNVIENAVNAIHERDGKKLKKGELKIVVKMSQNDTLAVSICDNGRGLPEDVDVEDLLNP